MNRRSFFNRIARAAAIVALAPQLCFRAKPFDFEVLQEGQDAQVAFVNDFFYGGTPRGLRDLLKSTEQCFEG